MTAVLIDSSVLLDLMTEGCALVFVVGKRPRASGRQPPPRHQSGHLCRGLGSLFADRGTRRRPAESHVRSRSHSIRSRLSGRKIVPDLSASRRCQASSASGFLHWRPCGHRGVSATDPRRVSLPYIFPQTASDCPQLKRCSVLFRKSESTHIIDRVKVRSMRPCLVSTRCITLNCTR